MKVLNHWPIRHIKGMNYLSSISFLLEWFLLSAQSNIFFFLYNSQLFHCRYWWIYYNSLIGFWPKRLYLLIPFFPTIWFWKGRVVIKDWFRTKHWKVKQVMQKFDLMSLMRSKGMEYNLYTPHFMTTYRYPLQCKCVEIQIPF